MIKFSMHVFKNANDQAHNSYTILIASRTVPVYCEASSKEMIYQLQMCFVLILADSHHTFRVPRDVVLDCGTDLICKLESKATFHVAITASANVEELGVKLPHLLRNWLVLVSIVDKMNNALDTLFDTV